MKLAVTTGCGALFCLTWSGSANAYLDPSTGSILLQAIIATVAAGFASVGIFWQKLKGVFRRQKGVGSGLDRDTSDR